MDDFERMVGVCFDGFMAANMPSVVRGTSEWFFLKKGFIGGMCAGCGTAIADMDKFTRLAGEVYEKCEASFHMARLFNHVPEEHRVILSDGTRRITELGVIDLATKFEAEDPANADYFRQIRRLICRHLQSEKEGRDQ